MKKMKSKVGASSGAGVCTRHTSFLPVDLTIVLGLWAVGGNITFDGEGLNVKCCNMEVSWRRGKDCAQWGIDLVASPHLMRGPDHQVPIYYWSWLNSVMEDQDREMK